MHNLFDLTEIQKVINRVNQLTPHTKGSWGKMHVSQMLAHCCISFELVFENKHPRPNAISRFLIKLFAKKTLVGDKPYAKNARTSPIFIIDDMRDFEKEKVRLIDYIQKTQIAGPAFFKNKEHYIFGALTIEQWNNLLFKHLDHHLKQFGV